MKKINEETGRRELEPYFVMGFAWARDHEHALKYVLENANDYDGFPGFVICDWLGNHNLDPEMAHMSQISALDCVINNLEKLKMDIREVVEERAVEDQLEKIEGGE